MTVSTPDGPQHRTVSHAHDFAVSRRHSTRWKTFIIKKRRRGSSGLSFIINRLYNGSRKVPRTPAPLRARRGADSRPEGGGPPQAHDLEVHKGGRLCRAAVGHRARFALARRPPGQRCEQELRRLGQGSADRRLPGRGGVREELHHGGPHRLLHQGHHHQGREPVPHPAPRRRHPRHPPRLLARSRRAELRDDEAHRWRVHL